MKFRNFFLVLSVFVLTTTLTSCNNNDDDDPIEAIRYSVSVENDTNSSVFVFEKTDLNNDDWHSKGEVAPSSTPKLLEGNYVLDAEYTFGISETNDKNNIIKSIKIKNADAEKFDYTIKVSEAN